MHGKDLYPAVETFLKTQKELSFRIRWK